MFKRHRKWKCESEIMCLKSYSISGRVLDASDTERYAHTSKLKLKILKQMVNFKTLFLCDMSALSHAYDYPIYDECETKTLVLREHTRYSSKKGVF